MKQDNNPLVSVLMAVYNGAQHIASAISSILKQTYQNFEFVIIDDGSTDNTSFIIDSFRKKTKNIRLYKIPHSGLSAALNTGLDYCRGVYVARIDADDVWHPKKLEIQIHFLRMDPSIKLLGCSVFFIDNSNHIISYRGFNQGKEINHKRIITEMFHQNKLCSSGVIFNKSILYNIGKYDESLRTSMDYDLWLRIILKHKAHILSEHLVFYRISNQSMTRQKKNIMLKEAIHLHNKYYNQFKNELTIFTHIKLKYYLLKLRLKLFFKL